MLNSKMCPNCNSEQPLDAGFCSECGNGIKYITYTLDQNLFPEEHRIYRRCSACTKFYNSNLGFCNECGAKTESRLFTRQEAVDFHSQETANNTSVKPVKTNSNEVSNGYTTTGMIIGLSAALLMFVSLFMPYCKAQAFGFSTSVSYWEKATVDGYLICLGLVFIIYNFIKKKWLPLVLDSILLFAISLYDSYAIKESIDEGYRFLLNWGIGYYLLIITPIIMIVAAIILKIGKNKN